MSTRLTGQKKTNLINDTISGLSVTYSSAKIENILGALTGRGGSYIGQSFATYADLSAWFLALQSEEIKEIYSNDFTFIDKDENYDDHCTLYIFTNTDANLSVAYARTIEGEQKAPISSFDLDKMFTKGYIVSYQGKIYEILATFITGSTTLEQEFEQAIEAGNFKIISTEDVDTSEAITNDEIDEIFAEVFKK